MGNLTPDGVMVDALEAITALKKQIWPMQPRKNAKPPFCFYLQISDDEDEALDAMTGLQHTSYQLHAVAGSYRSLDILCGRIKAAIRAMTGRAWARPDTAVCDLAVCDKAAADVGAGGLLVEDAQAEQVSPDLYDDDVGFFRRVYQVDIDYQTEGSDALED